MIRGIREGFVDLFHSASNVAQVLIMAEGCIPTVISLIVIFVDVIRLQLSRPLARQNDDVIWAESD